MNPVFCSFYTPGAPHLNNLKICSLNTHTDIPLTVSFRDKIFFEKNFHFTGNRILKEQEMIAKNLFTYQFFGHSHLLIYWSIILRKILQTGLTIYVEIIQDFDLDRNVHNQHRYYCIQWQAKSRCEPDLLLIKFYVI